MELRWAKPLLGRRHMLNQFKIYDFIQATRDEGYRTELEWQNLVNDDPFWNAHVKNNTQDQYDEEDI